MTRKQAGLPPQGNVKVTTLTENEMEPWSFREFEAAAGLALYFAWRGIKQGRVYKRYLPGDFAM